ncbi:ankyrin repeat protein, putative [Trichomonas vaginalis G3]|uniref:Ankyrin repeat protein, putative n=1 Tax=Trichomonas vaginalis (strain ATCC PRA-98 / G3) TaxID=412133 RepID=A2FQX5_TRIV3|nr:proteasome regulatory particle assembly [Trichomonas vaginalis G3]EAX92680.1 ankyrin repeat protein, putative [Trichomonas vaginalis G3]KAI5552993.1 proteasome regulatory particle assembly [Trichomonas vaginalis G3]|eukprot:XP_001305610.1 ankyrin repeat protein [Trichomonas vaginalis G3]
MAEYLLSHGANVNEKNKYGETVLHKAIKNNNKEMAEFLLSHGANINEKDNLSETALHSAAGKSNKDMIEFLLSHGANILEKIFLMILFFIKQSKMIVIKV